MGRGPNRTLHLLILGFLRQGPSHPYGMLSVLRQIQAHRWTSLNRSAVYYTFKRLEADSYIQTARTQREESSSERTIFEITGKGRKYLATLIRDGLAELIPIQPPIYPAVLYAGLLDPETLLGAMSERIAGITQVVEALEEARDRDPGRFGEPLRELLRHAILLNRAEIEWCRSFSEAARSGDLYVNQTTDSGEAL